MEVTDSRPSTLMTSGPIWKKIVTFAFPLFLGNLFQQLYNTADSLIVGNFLGSDALAAVSSSGSLIFLLVGFFNGIFMGAGVVVARYYGAQCMEKVQRTIHTMIALAAISGVLLTIIGLIFAPKILVLMGTPKDVLPSSILYFRVYFLGSLGFILYNASVGIMQSAGDSKHPLQYLIISSLVNILLDLLFIGVLNMGVGSAAVATIISQFVSAVLCLRRLLKTKEAYRLIPSKIRIDGPLLKQILSNGLPSGMQNSIISIANVVVQSNINAFGKMAVAGCGAYSKIQGFGFLPIACFAMALTTFVSQNLGAKEYERAKKGAKFGIICSLIMAESVGLFIRFTAPYLVAAFGSAPEMVSFGVRQAHTDTFFYFLLAFSHCSAGILRGAGKSKTPMFVMLICWCIIRISYITVAVRIVPSIQTVFWAYPITWALSSVIFLYFIWKADWIHGHEKKLKVSEVHS